MRHLVSNDISSLSQPCCTLLCLLQSKESCLHAGITKLRKKELRWLFCAPLRQMGNLGSFCPARLAHSESDGTCGLEQLASANCLSLVNIYRIYGVYRVLFFFFSRGAIHFSCLIVLSSFWSPSEATLVLTKKSVIFCASR